MVLTTLQREIVAECLRKRKGCLCVPMGTGKTLIGLTIINRIGSNMPALVVCSKTLIGSWVSEINKFFGDKLKYAVYHKDYMGKQFHAYRPTVGTDVVLTTPEVLVGIYKEHNIHSRFVVSTLEDRGGPFPTRVNRYIIPTRPFLPSVHEANNAFIYSFTWKCLLIDEVQQFTNIESVRCEAISSVLSRYRWATTGTPITEPKIARLLGYYLLIGDDSMPNSIPDAATYLASTAFPGLLSTMVIRTQDQLDFTLPKHTETIISHTLTWEEEAVYTTLKEVIKQMQATAEANPGNTTLLNSINSQLLSMILYTRQSLVCPLLPYTILMLNGSKRNIMSKCFAEEISKLNLEEWLQDENASRSSRINEIISVLGKHPDERCIVFTCFRTNLNVMEYYISKDTGRVIFTINAKQSAIRRGQVLEEFGASDNGILLLTYGLGAEGLNLQSSHVVLLSDVWWNDSKMSQAIARVLRRGQTEEVSIYLFTSNTGLEKSLYEKHIDKRTIINSLMTGKMVGEIRPLNMKAIVRMITTDEVLTTFKSARKMVQ